MTNLIFYIRYDSDLNLVTATLLVRREQVALRVLQYPGHGAFHSRFGDNSWLIGREATKAEESWKKVALTDKFKNDSNGQLSLWRLMTGLFLQAAEDFRTEIENADRKTDVVVVWSGFDEKSEYLRGWVRIVLERLEWQGQGLTLKSVPQGSEGVELGPDFGTSMSRYNSLRMSFDKANASARKPLLFGQRRLRRQAWFELQDGVNRSSGKFFQVAAKDESLPVQLDARLILPHATGGAGYRIRVKTEGEIDTILMERDNGSQHADTPALALVPAKELERSDPNGGARVIVEIDRFGRVYLTLRDEAGRLIELNNRTDDGRTYLANWLITAMSRLTPGDAERLPGELAATSFNGRPCEDYHADFRARSRAGDLLHYDLTEMDEPFRRFLEDWRSENATAGTTRGSAPESYLYERILAGEKEGLRDHAPDKVEDAVLRSCQKALIPKLIDMLPQDMYDFRGILNSLGQRER